MNVNIDYHESKENVKVRNFVKLNNDEKSIERAMREWELEKYSTPELVRMLLTRTDLSTDETDKLSHHAHTLECMGTPISDEEVKAQIEDI